MHFHAAHPETLHDYLEIFLKLKINMLSNRTLEETCHSNKGSAQIYSESAIIKIHAHSWQGI